MTRVGLVADEVAAPAPAPTSGIMISDARVAARLAPRGGRLGDRPHLHGEQAGHDQAEPHAAQARASGSARAAAATAASRRSSSGVGLAASPRDGHLDRSSVRSGRNSCSGGSSSRTVTGSPSIASRISTKSLALQRQQLGQRRLALVGRVGQDQRARPARGARRGTCARCGTARCPRRRTGGRGRRPRPVSALARTPSRRAGRRASAAGRRPHQSSTVVGRPARVRPSKYCTTGEATTGTSPRKTSPVVPSIEMTSPSLHGDAADA